MEQIFIENIKINKVFHLKDINIRISKDKYKHIIFTGKNGSGKTSVFNAMATFINSITKGENPNNIIKKIKREEEFLMNCNPDQYEEYGRHCEAELARLDKQYLEITAGVWIDFNIPFTEIRKQFESGQFIVAYYKADRIFSSIEPKHVEKVQLKSDYAIDDTPRSEFIKYLLDLKMTQALALANGQTNKAKAISVWFEKFDKLLKQIFEDESVQLVFDIETFNFSIVMESREPFDFNTLSSGYSAIFDIVADLIIRMEKQSNRAWVFKLPGVVLIDEIETHLHLKLQKNIMSMLTTIFPNIQFIVSTHSPFILNSLQNVVIYDLEKNVHVENNLFDVPYSGIVEGYFNADELSNEMREKFESYKKLADKPILTMADYEEIAELEMYLDEIPDYLALNLTTQYHELKAKLRARER